METYELGAFAQHAMAPRLGPTLDRATAKNSCEFGRSGPPWPSGRRCQGHQRKTDARSTDWRWYSRNAFCPLVRTAEFRCSASSTGSFTAHTTATVALGS
jgi:hypothetical protein